MSETATNPENTEHDGERPDLQSTDYEHIGYFVMSALDQGFSVLIERPGVYVLYDRRQMPSADSEVVD